MLGAVAHTTLPIPKTASPNRYDARAPTRNSAALTVVAATTDPTRYRVVTHAKSRSPPMSATVLGNRLMVRNSLIAYSATPPASSVEVPRYRGPSSTRQLPSASVMPVASVTCTTV